MKHAQRSPAEGQAARTNEQTNANTKNVTLGRVRSNRQSGRK